MTLIQRARFGDILQLITGFKADWKPDLGQSITPVIDVEEPNIALDDGVAHWWTIFNTAAPGAGNLQVAQVYFNAGVESLPNRRFSVEGFYCRPITSAYTVRYGLVSKNAGISVGAVNYRNPFLGQQPGTLTMFAIEQGTMTPAASIFGGFAAGLLDVPAPGGQIAQINNPVRFGIVSGQNLAFTLEVSNLNQPLSAVVWGRFWADQT